MYNYIVFNFKLITVMENNIKKLIKTISQMFKHDEVKIVVELGARDCNNTEIFHNIYLKSKIYAFECNPRTINICRNKILKLKRAQLIEKAVIDKNDKINFYPINQNKSEKSNWCDGNPGSSSIFKVIGKNSIERLIQDRITVPTTKLSSFMISEKIKFIDLLFMDIQGAELLALKGLEEKIKKVKIINTEVSFLELYKNQPLFNDIKKYLNEKGFVLYNSSYFAGPFADMVFVNRSYFDRPFSKIREFIISFYYSKLFYNTYRILRRYKFYKTVMKNVRKIIGFKPTAIYYLSHPLILFKNRLIIFKLWFKKIVDRDINFEENIYSSTPIDVVISAAEKDFDVLIQTIKSIRENIRHLIDNIIIISPKSETIINICKTNKCTFIDENTVLPITKGDINYTINGKDRSGWIFQQLLKWSSVKYVKNNYFLITDADTVFCRPQIFIFDKKVILSVNNSLCHIPYFNTYKKLLRINVEPLINLTNHHILYERKKLKELIKKIEKYNKNKWYNAILENLTFSDFETYGQYVFSNYADEYILEHWFNISLYRSTFTTISKMLKVNYNRYKTLSFHSYNQ